MWGRLFILRMREALQARIPETKWNIKEFHYQYLSLAGTPLSYVETHLNQWADCVIDPRKIFFFENIICLFVFVFVF